WGSQNCDNMIGLSSTDYHRRKEGIDYAFLIANEHYLTSGEGSSKYLPAKPGALVREPLKAA
ncbi:MAG: hypothetical protein PHR30_18985, partial [Gallionellaceae bacterium]|nr:hypothetical protein [Gallionellaceae bacterium]